MDYTTANEGYKIEIDNDGILMLKPFLMPKLYNNRYNHSLFVLSGLLFVVFGRTKDERFNCEFEWLDL